MASKAVVPTPSNTIEGIKLNLLEWYRYIRAVVNEFRA